LRIKLQQPVCSRTLLKPGNVPTVIKTAGNAP
jgi:hypothetical protein